MRLIRTETLELSEFLSSDIPPYAILSHTWDAEEVSFDDMKGDRRTALSKAGYRKIRQCCKKALLDCFDYLWVDTCCIDKRSSAELSEAINTMFKWYQNSAVCYAYLADVPSKGEPMSKNETFASSRWFTRGWTLQELIAPPRVLFLDQDWIEIGTKETLSNRIAEISGIHAEILASPYDPGLTTIAQKMSWAAGRKTTRDEDIAYCLLGLFGINMPLLYGEGTKAFHRLQLKLIKMIHDHSIFAWRGRGNPAHSGFLASSPDDFSDSATIRPGIPRVLEWEPYSWTNLGVRIRLDAVYEEHGSHDRNQFYVVLDCCHVDRPNTRIGVYFTYIGEAQRRTRINELHEVEYTESGALADQFGEPIYPLPKDYVEQSSFYLNIDP